MHRNQFVNYSEGVNNLDLNYMHPNLLMLLSVINAFCLENEIRFELTSIYRTAEKDSQLKAVSKTHQQGRAFDFSVKNEHGWSYEKIQFLVDMLNELVETEHLENGAPNPFHEIGAISGSDLKQRVIVVHKNHDGGGIHAHVQVRPTPEWSKKTHRR